MKKLFTQIIFLLTAVLITCGNTIQASASQSDRPFKAGEKITFEIKWSYILAGKATLELQPLSKAGGNDSCHILFKVRTSDFVDIFYKVRDSIESYVDLHMDHSLMYVQAHHAKSGKDSRVDFDWKNKQAQYSRTGSGIKAAPIDIPEGTFDPLSVFYAFRLYNLNVKDKIIIPVTDGKKVVAGKATVIKREVIQVGGVDYDAFLVEPEFGEVRGVFEMSSNAKLQVWVTADSRHIPLRVTSKVAVGSFTAEMTSYEEGAATEKDD
jgi:hypothetical protein